MTKTLFMLRGLPASGKSTLRKQLLTDPDLAPIVAVNKDEIRKSLGITPGDFAREKEVLQAETEAIQDAIDQGISLILDNTHNAPKHIIRYSQLAAKSRYEFKLIDLSNVPLEECIRRDSMRVGGERVGEAVIRRMWEQSYKS